MIIIYRRVAIKRRGGGALAQRVGCLERRHVHQNAVGSISGQGAYGRQSVDVSLSHQCFSLSLPLSLKSINISLGEDFLKEGEVTTNWAYLIGRVERSFAKSQPELMLNL